MRSFLPIIKTAFLVAALAAAGCGEDTPQDPGNGGGGGGGGLTIDTIPPATVSGLLPKAETTSSIVLQWFAPGDDGDEGQAAMYDIRWSTSEITGDNWDSANQVPDETAPKPAGEVEQFRVHNLPSGREIFFTLKTYDEVPNASGLCDNAKRKTKTEYMAPAEVDDLRAVAISDSEILLTWTAPGDDGQLGQASVYDIRYAGVRATGFSYSSAEQVIGEPDPGNSGEPDTCIVTGLDPDENYYFGLKTGDETPTWSAVSNHAGMLGWNNNMVANPVRAYIGTTSEIEIWFRTVPDVRTSITIPWRQYCPELNPPVYCTRIRRHLLSSLLAPGVHRVTWDLKDDAGEFPVFSWGTQVYVRLHYNGVIVDSTMVQMVPE